MTKRDQDINSKVTADVSSFKKGMRDAAEEAKSAAEQVKRQGREVEQSADSWRKLGEQASREMGRIAGSGTQVLTGLGNQNRALSAMSTSWRRMAELGVRAMGSLGAGLGVVGSAAAGVALVLHQVEAETVALNKSLIMTGRQGQVTAGQLHEVARTAAASYGQLRGQVAAAIAEVVSAGHVSVEMTGQVAAAAVRMRNATGQAVADTAREFAELGKAPLTALLRLNESYNSLTFEVYEQVKALEAQGRMADAAALAQSAHAETLDRIGLDIEQNLGTVEWLWRSVRNAAREAWDAMLNVGREDTLEQRIERQAARVAELAAGNSRMRAAGGGGLDIFIADDWQVDKANQELAALQAQLDAERAVAEEKRKQAEINKALIDWAEAGEQYRTREQRMQVEINQARELGLRAGLSELQIEERIAAIRERHAPRGGGGRRGSSDEAREAARAAREAERALREQARAEEAAIRAARDGLEQLERQVVRQREANEEIGLSAGALADLKVSRLEDAAAMSEQAEAAAALMGLTSGEVEAYRRKAVALKELVRLTREGAEAQARADADAARRKAMEDAARDAEREWLRTAQSIEQSLTDALMRGFESGKGFAETLRDTLRNMFRTLVLRPLIQPVAAGAAGLFAPNAMAGAGGSGGGLGGLGGNPLSMLTGNSIGMGMSNVMTGLGSSSMLAGTGAGNFLTGAAGNVAGMSNMAFGAAGLLGGLGAKLLFGGKGQSTTGGSLGATVGMAFGSIGALVGGLLGGALGSLIGGKPSNKAAWGEVDLSSGELRDLGNMTGKKQASEETMNARTAMLSGAAAAAAVINRLGGNSGVSSLRVDVGERDGFQADFGAGLEQLGYDGEAAMRTTADRLVTGAYETFDAGVRAIVDELRAAGREVIEALAWVAELETLNRWLERLGVTALDISVAGADAAAALAEVAGGVEALAAMQQQYYEQFFSDEEKLLHLRADLSAMLGELGMEMVHSREQYRGLIEGLDLMTEEGRAAYVMLLAAAPEMSRYVDLLEDQTDAADSAADANRAYADALREMQRAAQDNVNRLQRLSSLLRGTLEQMDIGTVASQTMRRSHAQAEIATAVAIARASGGRALPEADDISAALSRVAEPSQGLFTNFTDYARDFYVTANDIAALAEMTDEQLSVEQQTLKWLKDRADAEDLVYATQIAQQTITAETLTAQTGILDAMAQSLRLISKEDQPQQSANRTPNINYGPGMSIDTGALGVVMNPVTGEILWDGLSNYSRQQAEAMAAALEAMNEAEREEYLRTRSVPGFATGGAHAGGWRVVGERGPELEYTGPSMIFNRAQAGGLVDMGPVRDELRALREDMQRRLDALLVKAHVSARVLQQWNDEGMPEARE